ncbi:MAG: hypothetical protein HKN76_04875 [Saprospiraceae bacterium]|nr:hypothetical protein [Saprospiraceae bacterium]
MKTKRIMILIYFCALAGFLIAQTPGFNYQAVLRNAAGEIMTNADVTLHFSLIDGPTSTVIYKENQILSTDELGILTCMIGSGTVESGTFSDITGVQDLNIKIEAELPGETGMTEIGTSKLGVIPYALYGKDEDSDPGNEMQELSLEGDSLHISGSQGVSLMPIKSPWTKVEDGYELDLTGPARNDEQDEVSIFRLTRAEGLTLQGENATRCISPNGDRIFRLANPAAGIESRLTLFEPSKTTIVSSKITNGQNAHSRNQELSDIEFKETQMVNDQKIRSDGLDLDEACNVFTDLFFKSEFVLGMLGFGEGSNNNSRAATYGGTFSTANDNGLTTLSGALPGLDPMNGHLIIFNGQNLGVSSTINSELAGTSSTYGANGQINTTAGTFAGDADGGALITYDQTGNTGAYVWTKNDGTSQVGADQFVMTTSPPGRADQLAAFSAPVGGEAAAYDRGTATLVNGEATVICPEHFGWVADENSMTVTITPLSADSQGIAVIEKSNGGFKVKELNGGTGNYSFDYLVMCKRKGLEEYEVVRKKPQIMSDNSTEILKNLPSGPLSSIRDLVPKKSSN